MKDRKDLRDAVEDLYKKVITDFGKDSDEAEIVCCWLDELDGLTSGWYQVAVDLEKQRNCIITKNNWLTIGAIISVALNIFLFWSLGK